MLLPFPSPAPPKPGARGGEALRLPPHCDHPPADPCHAGRCALPVSAAAWHSGTTPPVPCVDLLRVLCGCYVWSMSGGQCLWVGEVWLNEHVVAATVATPCACSEDQGLFPGQDLPVYTRELKYGSPQHPIRWELPQSRQRRPHACPRQPCAACLCSHALEYG